MLHPKPPVLLQLHLHLPPAAFRQFNPCRPLGHRHGQCVALRHAGCFVLVMLTTPLVTTQSKSHQASRRPSNSCQLKLLLIHHVWLIITMLTRMPLISVTMIAPSQTALLTMALMMLNLKSCLHCDRTWCLSWKMSAPTASLLSRQPIRSGCRPVPQLLSQQASGASYMS